VSTRQDELRKKRASLVLALLLAAAAIALTVISLQDGRAPKSAPAEPPIAAPTATADLSSEIAGPPDASSGASSGGGSSGGSSGEARCVLESAGAMSCPKHFSIAGSAGGLYPGKTVQLPLIIENPYEEDIRVTAVNVSVTGTSVSSCDTSNLQTPDYAGPAFVVRGNDSVSFALQLTMQRSAPDACQSVTFTLAFNGEAEQA
jgi:hypothetical protein